MSKEPVEQEMRRLLSGGQAETMCVSGAWGVGKTFLWAHVLRSAKDSSQIAVEGYSYVSLFGIADLEGLKQAIFENRVSTDQIGEPITPLSIERNIRRFSGPLLKLAEDIPMLGGAIKHASPFLTMSIAKQLICIDDLERKGAGLSVREVLGFATYLKEQRSCQVVLLTNYDDLQGDDKAQYDQYQEKVFDRVLVFEPTPEYCASIAIPNDTTGMRERIVALRISNIRVINKIKRLVLEVQSLLKTYNPRVFDQAVHTLVLAGWMKYTKGAPPFSFLNERHSIRFMEQRQKDKEPNQQFADWNATLDAYRFSEIDALDRELINAINNGFLDAEAIKSAADDLHRDAKTAEAAESRRQAWRRFHDSFRDNEEEVVQGFVESYGTSMQNVGAGSLNHVIVLLRQLGRDAEADGLIGKYVEVHEGNPRAFDLDAQREYGEEIDDPRLVSEMAEHLAKSIGKADSIQALRQLETGGNRRDYEVAAAVTTDELIAALETLEGQALNNFIKTAMRMASTSAYGIDTAPATVRMREALTTVGKKSSINRTRVRRMGIDPDIQSKPKKNSPKRQSRAKGARKDS